MRKEKASVYYLELDDRRFVVLWSEFLEEIITVLTVEIYVQRFWNKMGKRNQDFFISKGYSNENF